MTIYSWNMLFRNKELEQAFQFIATAEFDFFCLQEVPEHFLTRLKTLPFHHAYRIDADRLFEETTATNYNLILSKHPITNQGEFAYPDYWDLLPLRSLLFIAFMRFFHFTKIQNRGGLYIDASIDGKVTRIFDLHLILAHPSWRLKEFEIAMTGHSVELPTIVCGDFNILESPHITVLNWLMGGKVGDAALYTRERTHIEKHFVERELQNPLRGTITHPLSRSQLDHILLSRHLVVEEAIIIQNRYGSDHNPIRVRASYTEAK